MGSWSDWFTGKGSGLTDAEYAAQQKARIAAQKKETDATLARWKQDSKARVQANTPTQEERDFQRARNTRVDQLTPEQRRLIQQGRPDTAGETMDRYLAKNYPVSKYLSSAETDKKSSTPTTTTRTSRRTGSQGPQGPQGANSNEEVALKRAPVEQTQFSSSAPLNDFSARRQNNTSFNINRFRAEVTGADAVLPTHSFLVVFSPFKTSLGTDLITDATPSEVRNEVLSLGQRVTMRCDNIVLPNLSLLQEQNIRRYGYGTVENVAYGINNGDVTMQFIVDSKSDIVYFFERWFDLIVNRDSKGGADMKTPSSVTKYAPYEVGYKDDYSCPVINVFVYDRSNRAVMEYNIYDAFPINLQSINLSWEAENSLLKINVSFAFTDFKINTPKGTEVEERLKILRQESKLALEEKMNQQDEEYQANLNRQIQETLAIDIPTISIGDGNAPVVSPTVPTSTQPNISLNTVTIKTPGGSTVAFG